MTDPQRATEDEREPPAGADPAAGPPVPSRPPGGPAPTVEQLQAEVERLTETAERNWQHFLRAAADLENYRKQATRLREEAVAATRRSMIMVILNVVDTLERALAHTESLAAQRDDETAAIVDGIRLVHRQVLETLAGMGVRPMEALGRAFDPRWHEAVDAVAGGAEPGTVVAEIQRGYLLDSDVLRPARVRVAQ